MRKEPSFDTFDKIELNGKAYQITKVYVDDDLETDEGIPVRYYGREILPCKGFGIIEHLWWADEVITS